MTPIQTKKFTVLSASVEGSSVTILGQYQQPLITFEFSSREATAEARALFVKLCEAAIEITVHGD